MSKPKLIDFKLLNDELNIKMLSLKLDKSLQKINSAKPPLNNVKPPPLNNVKPLNNVNNDNVNPIGTPHLKKYNKISILFNLILGLIIISIPAYLYYRHKTKTSKFEKDKKIIDVVSKINNKIGLNPEYKSFNTNKNTDKNTEKKININTNKNTLNHTNIRQAQYINLY